MEEFKSFTSSINASAQLTRDIVFDQMDAYGIMTQTSTGNNAEMQKVFKKAFFEYFKLSTKPQDDDSELQQQFCMVTGTIGGSLKLAHLVPASASQKVLKMLNISTEKNTIEVGVWNLRNALVLSWNIEKCFDKKQLSFVPQVLSSTDYVMKIWDDSIRNMKLYDNDESSNTIGKYDGSILNLQTNSGLVNPLKRALSYQAFMSYYASNKKLIDEPADFCSVDETPQFLDFRRNLMLFKNDLLKSVFEDERDDEYEENEENLSVN